MKRETAIAAVYGLGGVGSTALGMSLGLSEYIPNSSIAMGIVLGIICFASALTIREKSGIWKKDKTVGH